MIQTLAGRFRKATRTTISYYKKLTFYYDELQNYEKVKEYHVLILELTKHLTCTRGYCVFTDIAYIYFNSLHDYEKSAYFFELALQQESFRPLEKAELMLKLHRAYSHTESQSQCKRVELELLSMFPEILTASSSETLKFSLGTVLPIANLYRAHNGTDEANALDDRLLQVMKEHGRQPTRALAHRAKLLVLHYYESQVYARAAEMASLSLSFHKEMSAESHDLHMEVELWFLAGQALYQCGNYSDGLDYLDHALDLAYEHNVTDHFTEKIDSVCFYLIRRGRLQCLLGKAFRFVSSVYTIWPWISLRVVDELIPEAQVAKPTTYTTEQTQEFSTTLALHDRTGLVSSVTPRINSWFEAISLHLSRLWTTLLTNTYIRAALRLGMKAFVLAVDLLIILITCCAFCSIPLAFHLFVDILFEVVGELTFIILFYSHIVFCECDYSLQRVFNALLACVYRFSFLRFSTLCTNFN